jgi:hypothetical protein
VAAGWAPQPDLQPGDWVDGRMDNGYTATVQLGTITGAVDVDEDTVAGTVTASGLPNPVSGRCEVWQPGGPGYDLSLNPNGGAYLCDTTNEWDLLPGQQVAISYREPDGDTVIEVFQAPAPRVRIETWADGRPGAGGTLC